MRSITSLRDAELVIGQLQNQLDKLKTSSDTSGMVDTIKNQQTQIITLQKKINQMVKEPSAAGVDQFLIDGIVYHRLPHIFNKLVKFLQNIAVGIIAPLLDSVTGIQITKADQVTPIVTIDTTNKRVGIGTVAPGQILEVAAPNTTMILIRRNDSATASGALAFYGNSGSAAWSVATNYVVSTGFEINQGGTNRFYITTGGNILINSTSDNGSGAKLQVTGNTTLGGGLVVTGNMGFFGAAAVTQQVLAAYTSNNQNTAYTGINNAQAGTIYATVADLNTLRVAYQNLKAAYDDLRTKLQGTTLVG